MHNDPYSLMVLILFFEIFPTSPHFPLDEYSYFYFLCKIEKLFLINLNFLNKLKKHIT